MTLKKTFAAGALACSLALTPAALAADSCTSGIVQQDANQEFDPGKVHLHGKVSVTNQNTAPTNVVFVMDLSGSTAMPDHMDCNGDGVKDAKDNFNRDTFVGDVLDCEVSAVQKLNAQLAALPSSDQNIRVSVVAFGSNAHALALDPNGATWVAPGHTVNGQNAVNFVTHGTTAGSVKAYQDVDVSYGTDFHDALEAAYGQLDQVQGDKYIFFLSDGNASLYSSTKELLKKHAADVKLRTFAVGKAAKCDGTPLSEMAQSSGESCTHIIDPASLSTALTSSTSASIKSVTVTYQGKEYPATIDAIGNISVDLPETTPGAHTAKVVVHYSDGTSATSCDWTFRVKGTPAVTPSPSVSASPSPSPSVSASPSATAVPSTTPSVKPSASPSASVSPSATATPSATVTATPSASASPSTSATPSVTATPSAFASPSASPVASESSSSEDVTVRVDIEDGKFVVKTESKSKSEAKAKAQQDSEETAQLEKESQKASTKKLASTGSQAGIIAAAGAAALVAGVLLVAARRKRS
ncbi:MAG: vWA domain-containing protein [Rothia sp. (in: high G+C Gram-positive bacteria)]|uniref:vWA domain-containing protein n=1 Tax=Rothia sp. (in: high G+C Gram-positive bacteria) TaxID=1885016 RepID=UPI0026E010A1|nr:vWA domain-containing protein [Rothia sp. (in: high G+C Gram-positive bacteria)]MDO5750353.1 vWA domain-containing protein [Rothia sp. (in: high G+C Gram-positive bacteria)]